MYAYYIFADCIFLVVNHKYMYCFTICKCLSTFQILLLLLLLFISSVGQHNVTAIREFLRPCLRLSHFSAFQYYIESEKNIAHFWATFVRCIFRPAECFLMLLICALFLCWMEMIEVIYSNVQGTLMKWWLSEKFRSNPNNREWVAKRWQVITLPSCHFRLL